jgi:predicted CoA-binding protein
MPFVNPSPEAIQKLLASARTIAVVGFSPKPSRPSHQIAHGLQSVGYRVIPVRPALHEGLGEQAYPSLSAIPHPVDIVDVFRAPRYVPAIVDECLALGLKVLWLQDGVVHRAAAERAVAGGMTVVMDRCILRDYTSFCRRRARGGE